MAGENVAQQRVPFGNMENLVYEDSKVGIAVRSVNEQFILPDNLHVEDLRRAKTEAVENTHCAANNSFRGSDLATVPANERNNDNGLNLRPVSSSVIMNGVLKVENSATETTGEMVENKDSKSFQSENGGDFDSNNEGLDFTRIKPLPCGVCGEVFFCEKTLFTHLTVHENEKQEQHLCVWCLKVFRCKQGLNNHMNVHTGIKVYTCNICSKSFRHKSNLTVHLKIHTGIKLEKCNICSKAFHNRSDLRSHIRVHTNERPHSCPRCFRRFSRAYDLKLHLRRLHTNEKPFNCESCLNCFATISELKTHVRRNQCKPKKLKVLKKSKPFICLVCYKDFPKKSAYDMHIKLHFQLSTVCSNFDIRVTEQQMLVPTESSPVHDPIVQNSSSDIPPLTPDTLLFKPDRINTSAISEKQVATNIKNRSGVKIRRKLSEVQMSRFHCIICLKTFTCNQTLKNHMNIHTGDKHYTCDICAKVFRHKSNLTVHTKIHTGVKREKCNLCSQAFHNRSDLRSHMRVHTNERPHVCPQCYRRFSRAYDLKLHIRRLHTKEKPYTCDSCGHNFASVSDLKMHLRRNQCKGAIIQI